MNMSERKRVIRDRDAAVAEYCREQCGARKIATANGRRPDAWGVPRAAGVNRDALTGTAALFASSRRPISWPRGSRRGEQTVEPASNFVGRGTKNFRDGETTIGGEVTSVTRTLGDAVLRNALPSSALVGGLDLNHSWSHHQWAVDANIARSQVSGSASAISLIQQSSARYFQRPDAVRDRLDSTRTSLEGYDTQLAFSRLTGHWVGSVALQDVAPGFETNDLGRLRDAGRRSLSLDLHYQEYTPGAHFQRYIIWPFTQQVWNYDGQLVANKYNLYLFGEWRNRWATGIEYDYYAPVADDRLTRGGPLARAPASHHFYYEVRSPSSNRVSVSSSTNMVVTEAGGQAVTMTNSVIWQARSNLRLELDPTIATTRDPAQYVTAYPDARATQTFARRTVFATLHQPMVELDGHADWVLSPRLTLQAYVQQLIVASRFSEYKALAVPGTYSFDVYGRDIGTATTNAAGETLLDADGAGPSPSTDIGQPDFSVRTTRLNAVLRWELRPGSSLVRRVATYARRHIADGRVRLLA